MIAARCYCAKRRYILKKILTFRQQNNFSLVVIITPNSLYYSSDLFSLSIEVQ